MLNQQQVDAITKRYPEGKQKSALLPVLHLAQRDNGGWLSVEVMDAMDLTGRIHSGARFRYATTPCRVCSGD